MELWNLLLPTRKVVIDCHFGMDEARNRIENSIQPMRSFREHLYDINGKPFEGTFAHDSFKVTRVIRYRNSFLPVITGRLEWTGEACRLSLNMTLRPFVRAFMLIWLGAAFFGCVEVTYAVISAQASFSAELAIPYGILIFGFLLMRFAFRPEANKASQYFQELLQ
ncbi:MAG: hypothetical protein A2X94_10180 [Bdellovibrionales bacterium GWB1_55_8]|nr:MAG: hypothetical protein A2X94_10180 [Bdellovibrionales bacterium GWB1_55_8]